MSRRPRERQPGRFLTFEEVEDERLRLETKREEEHRQRLVAEERADLAQQRSARLAEWSRQARHQQAPAAELDELQRLEEQASPP